MTRLPLISMVMTVRDGEAYIAETLRRVRQIEDDSFELVIFDDGSADRTLEICGVHASERIRLAGSQRLGRGAALNRAIANARGDVVAINDADDLPYPWRLRLLRHALAVDPAARLYGTGSLRTTRFGLLPEIPTPGPAPETRRFSASSLYRSNFLAHSAVAFRKEHWLAAGRYDKTLTSCIDYEFYFRLLGSGHGAVVAAPGVTIFDSPGSVFKNERRSDYARNLDHAHRTARRLCTIGVTDRLIAAARSARLRTWLT